jgi:TetR/AcrR family transcriptional regulator, cholesterol catabolism regulator
MRHNRAMPRKTQGKRKDPSEAIVEAALALAIEGGFDNVRQREVAARAGVTLRTLYRKFPNKHELLAAGLSRSVDELHRRLAERPIRARKPSARLAHLFAEMTAAFCDQPNLGRAVVRALVSGSTFSAQSALAYYARVLVLVLQAMRGTNAEGEASVLETERALLLLQVWFAGLVSWLAGAVDAAGINALIATAIRHLVRE